MLTVYPFEELGGANHGWLNAKHHFSFSSYYNPERMGFGPLRVINDDIIKPGTGFATHPHADMEIITYVRRGAITHRDNQGNVGRTAAGDVQVMSAGSGIQHSEHNLETEDTQLYQIWIEPNKMGITPRWDAKEFPKQPVNNELNLLVSGDSNAPLTIQQNATIHAGNLRADTELKHKIRGQAYLLVSMGEIEVDGQALKAGDGAEVVDQAEIQIRASSDAEVLVIDVPASNRQH